MKFKSYSNYKDSGVEWLGNIPENWETQKMKNLSFFQEGPGLRNWQFKSNGIRVICVTNITENGIDFSSYEKFISEDEYKQSYKHFKVENGDLLLSSSGNSWGKVAEYLSDETVILNTSTIRINKNKNNKVKREFLKWALQSDSVREQLGVMMTGSCQPNFGPSHLSEAMMTYPVSLDEQNSIVTFLDKKTSEIDKTIEKDTRLIELLQEKRTALINHVVTKGLDLEAKMKDSGVEWIGEIPEDWEIKKLKLISTIVLGKMLTPSDKGGYYLKPYLRAQNISWEHVNTNEIKEMWFSKNELNIYRLHKDDLLVSEGGEVGRTAIWKEEVSECYIQNSVHKVTLNPENNPKYFLYAFESCGKSNFFSSIVNRVSIAHLTREKLKEITFPVPNKREQTQITDYLNVKTTK